MLKKHAAMTNVPDMAADIVSAVAVEDRAAATAETAASRKNEAYATIYKTAIDSQYSLRDERPAKENFRSHRRFAASRSVISDVFIGIASFSKRYRVFIYSIQEDDRKRQERAGVLSGREAKHFELV